MAKAPDAPDLYGQLGLRFVIVADSGTATEDVKKTIGPGLWRAHFVEVGQIIDRDGDAEGMGVLTGRDAKLEPEWLSHTVENFEALFKAIQSKIE